MDEKRFVLNDRVWERLEPLLPGKGTDSGRTGGDNRLFLETVFRRVRTGSPWRDLPTNFGNWNSQFRRFRRWTERGVFESLFKAMSDDPDLECAMIDGTIVSVHQKATGAKGGSTSRHPLPGSACLHAREGGGLTTKIVALVDALGNLVRFLLLPGQAHDMKGVAPLIKEVSFGALLAPSRDISFGHTLPGNGQGV